MNVTEWTLSLVGSMVISLEDIRVGSSSMAQRAHTTSAAVCRHRRNGDTKTRWIGKSSLSRSFRPVEKARALPALIRGGSHFLLALAAHSGSKLSIRSPCLNITTFWYRSPDADVIACGSMYYIIERERDWVVIISPSTFPLPIIWWLYQSIS